MQILDLPLLLPRLGRETSPVLCSSDIVSAPPSQNSTDYSEEMDLQEVASRGNLWDQCFSDDMEGSPERAEISPTSCSGPRDILPKFTDRSTCVFSNSYNQTPDVRSPSGFHSGTGTTMSNGTTTGQLEEATPRASSPKDIPSSRGGSSHSNHCLPPQLGLHQVEPHSHGSQKKRTRSPKTHQKHGRVKGGTPGGSSSSPRKRSPVQHATSLSQMGSDEGGGAVGGCGLVEVKMETNGSRRSNSLYETSPYLATMRKQMSHGGGDDKSGITDVDNVIVRKLFPVPPQPFLTPPSSSSPSTSAMSPAVQTLFSRIPAENSSLSMNLSSSVGLPRGPVLSKHSDRSRFVSAVSLDEIEKQMTAETHDLRSSSYSKPLFQPSFSAGLKEAEPIVSPRVTSPSAGDKMVLLQPSAFTVPSPSVSFSLSSSPTAASSSGRPLLLPSVASSIASITTKPPSRAVVRDTELANSSSLSKSTMFPPIPPLIHSAGMTAPPLTTKPTVAKSTTCHRREKARKKEHLTPNKAASRDDTRAVSATAVYRADTSPPLTVPVPNSSAVSICCVCVFVCEC